MTKIESGDMMTGYEKDLLFANKILRLINFFDKPLPDNSVLYRMYQNNEGGRNILKFKYNYEEYSVLEMGNVDLEGDNNNGWVDKYSIVLASSDITIDIFSDNTNYELYTDISQCTEENYFQQSLLYESTINSYIFICSYLKFNLSSTYNIIEYFFNEGTKNIDEIMKYLDTLEEIPSGE